MLKFALTKKEAIYWHRRMWNWIAQTSIQEERCVTKDEALKHFEFDDDHLPRAACFCCEYTKNVVIGGCGCCPIKWGGDGLCFHAEFLMWKLFVFESDYVHAAKWAYVIAELPERPDENPTHPAEDLAELYEKLGEINDSLSELSKITFGCTEEDYQKKHKKVKDRYSFNKFYANNFKRNRRK